MRIYDILIMVHYKRRFLLFFFATNKAQKKDGSRPGDPKKRRQQPPQPPPPEIKHAHKMGILILSRFQMKAKNAVTGAILIQDHRKMIAIILDTIYILICTIYI